MARRVGAALACLLWVLGFEVGPSLHVWLHEEIGHHHHAGDGVAHHDEAPADTHEPEHEHEHEHGHEHGHEHDAGHGHGDAGHEGHDGDEHEDLEDDVGPEASCRGVGHGVHAIAHRTMVVTPTMAPWPPVAVAPLSFVDWQRAPAAAPTDRTPTHERARGPPAIG